MAEREAEVDCVCPTATARRALERYWKIRNDRRETEGQRQWLLGEAHRPLKKAKDCFAEFRVRYEIEKPLRDRIAAEQGRIRKSRPRSDNPTADRLLAGAAEMDCVVADITNRTRAGADSFFGGSPNGRATDCGPWVRPLNNSPKSTLATRSGPRGDSNRRDKWRRRCRGPSRRSPAIF
jgi:hypothetical protein